MKEEANMIDDGTWIESMGCHVICIKITSPKHITYHLAEQNAPDMRGTIDFTKAFAPDVEQIDVYAHGKRDICYQVVDNTWISVHHLFSPNFT
jgi:hypothetical protein